MFFYILIIPGIFFTILMIWRQVLISNRDAALYRFCALRRELMAFLRANYRTLTLKEFEDIERVKVALDRTIHYFHDLRADFFNFKGFKRIMIDMVGKTKKEDGRKYTFEKAKEFHGKLGRAYVLAFIDLVPLIKWRFASHIILLLSKGLFYLGWDKCLKFYKWLKNQVEIKHMEGEINLA